MEKEIDKIQKNPETDIVIRIDEYNGTKGLTIREFVKSERYTGFTKAGTRIPADKVEAFKKAISMVDLKDFEGSAQVHVSAPAKTEPKKQEKKQIKKEFEDVEF